jgi:hypothetical protein
MNKAIVSISSLVMALWASSSLPAGPAGISYQATPCLKAQVSSPRDYKVFIDKPTGFAFVCTPVGWTFVGAGARDGVEGSSIGSFGARAMGSGGAGRHR